MAIEKRMDAYREQEKRGARFRGDERCYLNFFLQNKGDKLIIIPPHFFFLGNNTPFIIFIVVIIILTSNPKY